MTTPTVGNRVRLRRAIERFPHFIADAGRTGTVTVVDPSSLIAVRMDETLDGAEPWDNEIYWTLDGVEDFAELLTEFAEDVEAL